MHRRLLGLLTIPGLGLVVSLLSDEQLAAIARWWGLAEVDVLAEFFPELFDEEAP